jgi:hypothetical protein
MGVVILKTVVFTNVVLQRHIAHQTMLYYSYCLHNFLAQIYHTFPFTTCIGLMGPSSGTLGFYNRQFLFLLLSPHWPVFTHWECVVCTVFYFTFLQTWLWYWQLMVELVGINFIWQRKQQERGSRNMQPRKPCCPRRPIGSPLPSNSSCAPQLCAPQF